MSERNRDVITGRVARALPAPSKDHTTKEDALPEPRLCRTCGAQLSRFNDGPLCSQCHDRHGKPVMPRIRGRNKDI